ncbi:MAG TPA: pentapeptide repeat-containing protein [Kofleriaceae bacterium]|nr:pentapeptide repeat-containing protein [Kofleriaceae bacterium]
MARISYLDSVRLLEELGYIEQGEAPAAPPERRPQFDDDARGLEFFRTRVGDGDFSDVTLPGTYFGRSEITQCSFRNADLRRSSMCWNDVVDVDFRGACLVECDLRASLFERCDFAGAQMDGAILSSDCSLVLSPSQREVIVWSDEDPPGG